MQEEQVDHYSYGGGTDAAVPPRRVVVAFADLVESSRLVWMAERAAAIAIGRALAAMGALAATHGGRIIEEAGDGVFAEFACCQGAVDWADAAHAAVACVPLPVGAPFCSLQLRIGIAAGPALRLGNRPFGRVVITACRLQQVALPGETLVADGIHQAFAEKPPIVSPMAKLGSSPTSTFEFNPTNPPWARAELLNG